MLALPFLNAYKSNNNHHLAFKLLPSPSNLHQHNIAIVIIVSAHDTEPRQPVQPEQQAETLEPSSYNNVLHCAAHYGYLHPGRLTLLAKSQEV